MTIETLKPVLVFIMITLGSSAYYSLLKSGRILGLFQVAEEPLTETEQSRLDQLLDTGKRYHNFSFIVAGILMALSSLSSFQQFAAPFGDIAFPKVQTSIGLFLLVVVLLIITDRYFLMAYPWLRLDRRRPPFHWIAMGLSFERSLFSGTIFYLPMPIAALGATIILGNAPSTAGIVTFSALSFSGFGLMYLPRTIYYWMHLIDVRQDHRGGSATLSVHLLYWYRMIRQIIYSVFITLPVILVIPQWQNPQFSIVVVYAVFAFGALYVIRMICGVKAIYRGIDRLGRRFGFPVVSNHYS